MRSVSKSWLYVALCAKASPFGLRDSEFIPRRDRNAARDLLMIWLRVIRLIRLVVCQELIDG